MIKEFKFKDVRKFLENDNDTAVLEAFDKISDIMIIFTPVLLGPDFLPILGLLDIKDRIVDAGKHLIDHIASKCEPNYIERAERIRIAYSLIVYTAYFEALSKKLPKSFFKDIQRNYNKTKILTELNLKSQNTFDITNNLPYSDHVTSISETLMQLDKIYSDATNRIVGIIKNSDLYAKNPPKCIQITDILCSVPDEAKKIYVAQYQYLANAFNDFGVYVQSIEFKSIYENNLKQTEILKYISNTATKMDVGMTELNSLIKQLPETFTSIQAKEIVDEIKERYKTIIEEPIINKEEILTNSEAYPNNSDSSSNETIHLSFPKAVEAFIPQSYKSLLYSSNGIKLEKTETWEKIEAQDNLEHFFLKYLSSPSSIENPLIILGHPGSGKSLLTKILSAQLMSDHHTVIRIPLREVNADLGIDVLVEQEIQNITKRPLVEGYGGFAKQFKEKPLLIILDGFDELLQAKGEVFAGYLQKVRRFQDEQRISKRPVRVIVTSRITLIDKAIVPINSTILRLLEFTPDQQQAWINIWNNHNKAYFETNNLKPFSLPKQKSKKKNSILELAEQPLLLLMLALYDSEGNSLIELQEDLKRAVLYDNLLRRFVRRERSRYMDFNELSEENQDKIIDKNMKRLGVVAIGMYNRKKLCIHTEELDNDLKVFEVAEEKNGKLKDSESLLSGFFFIHQSKAQDISANSDNSDNAYEFLHNTFGEFLTADIILQYAVYEVNIIKFYQNSDCMQDELRQRISISSPNGLCKQWFTCLMFTPLFSRPVVLEMLKEHLTNVLYKNNLSENEFIEIFNKIVRNQLQTTMSAYRFPEIMSKEHIESSTPLLGLIAIYTLNLVILASVFSKNGFVFEEAIYRRKDMSDSETKPWDKLTFLWHSWFSNKNLTELSSVLKTKKENDTIILMYNDMSNSISLENPIDMHLCVSNTFSDNLNIGLSGLHSSDFSSIVNHTNNEIASWLSTENKELFFSFMTNWLNFAREEALETINTENVNRILIEILNDVDLTCCNVNSILSFFNTVILCLDSKLIYENNKKALFDYLYDFKKHVKTKSKYQSVKNSLNIMYDKLCKDLRIIYNMGTPSSLLNYTYLKETLAISPFTDFINYKNFPYRKKLTNKLNIIACLHDNHSNLSTTDEQILYETFKSLDLKDTLQSDFQFVIDMLLSLPNYMFCLDTSTKFILDYTIDVIKEKTILFFDENTILQVIKLAKMLYSYNSFIIYVDRIAKHSIESIEILKACLTQYPTFVSTIIEIVPNFFKSNSNLIADLMEEVYQQTFDFSKESFISYVKILKTSNITIKSGYASYLQRQILKHMSYYTLKEIEDIIWLSQKIDSIKVLRIIKKRIETLNLS